MRALPDVVRLGRAFWVVCGAIALLAASAPKIVDGAWYDGAGNEVMMAPGSFVFDPLKPGARDLSFLVGLFDGACLKKRTGTENARAEIEARPSWGFRFIDADAGVSSGARMDGWQADDVSVTSQDKAWPLAECNVYAARSSADDFAAIVSAVSAATGVQPDNTYRAHRADGGKIDGRTARWSMTGPDAKPRRVYASVFANNDQANFIHLGLTEARPK